MSVAPAGLGVIAGEGALPRLLAEERRRAAAPYLVCAFEGLVPDWIAAHPHAVVPFEKPGALFRALRDAGAEQVVFAGGMRRPSLNPLRFDMKAAKLAATVLPMLGKGDDALLRGLASVFESEGFEMIGAHDLVDDLLAPDGVLSARAPSETDRADIARAAELAVLIGGADVGQAAVVARGLCLGLESIQGTDFMLRAIAETPEALRPPRPSGVLFKGPKPGQDWRLDLPAIGVDTVRAAHRAGLSGVALRSGGVLILGRAETVAEADRLGLFLCGVAAS